MGHGGRRASGELAGVPETAGQVERFGNSMISSSDFTLLLGGWVLRHAQHTGEARPGGGPHRGDGQSEKQIWRPPSRSSRGRQRSVSRPPLRAVSVQDLMAADTHVFRSGEGHSVHVTGARAKEIPVDAYSSCILRLSEARASELRREEAEYALSRAARSSRISLWARTVAKARSARAATPARRRTGGPGHWPTERRAA